jgi:hypothetical protein
MTATSQQWTTYAMPLASVLTGNPGACCPNCGAFLVDLATLQWHSCETWRETHRDPPGA